MATAVQLDGYQPADRHFAVGLADESDDADLWIEVDDRRFHFVCGWDRSSRYSRLTDLTLVGCDGTTTASSALDTDADLDADRDRIPGVVAEAVEGATYQYVDPDALTGPHRQRHITDIVEKDGRMVAYLLPGDGVLKPLRGILYEAARGQLEFIELRERCAARPSR